MITTGPGLEELPRLPGASVSQDLPAQVGLHQRAVFLVALICAALLIAVNGERENALNPP